MMAGLENNETPPVVRRTITSMEIVDFDMPFTSMVVFLLKLGLALALVGAMGGVLVFCFAACNRAFHWF
jgi:hypothetical protein